jgi:hypothetical protein
MTTQWLLIPEKCQLCEREEHITVNLYNPKDGLKSPYMMLALQLPFVRDITGAINIEEVIICSWHGHEIDSATFPRK